MKGVFAWVTCPKVLKQFGMDMKLSKLTTPLFNDFIQNGTAKISSNSNLVIGNSKKIVLEEYAFTTTSNGIINKLGDWLAENALNELSPYWQDKIKKDIVILSDDDFKDFVNLSTEVITRTKIDNATGTVANGALFTEEFLPAESVMYTMVLASDEFTAKEDRLTDIEVRAFFEKQINGMSNIIQIGGNATLGKGITRVHFLNHLNK